MAVERIPVAGGPDSWFFRVKEFDDYIFLHMPVLPGSVYTDNGTLQGEHNPDAKLLRYVRNVFSSVISGGNPSVKVDFVVMGYKPKDFLRSKK